MQQSEHKETPSSGTSNVPGLLAYPRTLSLKELPEIKDEFVYVIKGYIEQGLTIMIYREVDSGDVYLGFGDFDANPINMADEKHPLQRLALEFASDDAPRVISLMKVARIPQLIMYLSLNDGKLSLVDLRTSLNKFYGPGMIRDLFSKVYPTQEVLKLVTLDQNTIEAIGRGKGSYKGDLILKTSAFKTVKRGNDMLPMYARIERK